MLSSSVKSYLSDHGAVHCTLKYQKTKVPKSLVTYRNFKNINQIEFANDIRKFPLLKQSTASLNEKVEKYNTFLSDTLNKHAPMKTRSISLRPSVPWLPDAIFDAKRKRRRLERHWRKTKLDIDRHAFTKQRRIVSDMLTSARSDYFLTKISECGNDQKALFKIIDTLMNRRSKPKLPEHENIQDVMEIQKIRLHLDTVTDTDVSQPTSESSYPDSSPVRAMSHFITVTPDEISKLILGSPTKSCDLDPIPTWMVKLHLDLLLPPITDIINMSLTSGVVPESMRHALVTPLLKKQSLDPENPKNYRPVSNLPFVSKILEKVVAKQLLDHMETNGLHEPLQSAYRCGHSTETALVRVQNDLLRAVDRKQGIILVLLDLSAAFDTIDHDILLSRLRENIGIDGLALDWIKSYLSNRTQSIYAGKMSSSKCSLPFGVPQGSVLGPKFFCVYSGPIGSIAHKHGLEVHLYADDTQLYIFFSIKSDLSAPVQKVEACISEIRSWMRKNKLKLNDDKTEYMVISSDRVKAGLCIPDLLIGATKLKPSNAVRNLGAMFDDTLKMTNQISAITKRSHFHLRNIRSIRKSLTKTATEQLIHAFITSTLDNCNALLCGLPSNLIGRLQRIQNMAARVVALKSKYDSITPVLIDLHWLPVNSRIEFKILVLVWKALNGIGPSYIRDLLTLYCPARMLRSCDNMNLCIPKTRLKTYGDRAFSVAAPKLWNRLSVQIKSSKTLASFKQQLKSKLFQVVY